MGGVAGCRGGAQGVTAMPAVDDGAEHLAVGISVQVYPDGVRGGVV